MKAFLEVIKKADEPNATEDEVLEVFIEAGMVCLKQLKPELSEDRDLFEELIEVPTLMKILEVAGGLKLNDPNQLVANLDGMI